jgi:tetratricopeptide (TPR) repeat protein
MAIHRTGFFRAALGGLALLLLLTAGCSASREEVALSALHFFDKGNADFQSEDYRDAIRNYRRAIEYDPSRADFHYNLGLALYLSGDYRQAVKAYTDALRLEPAFADAQFNLALAYDKLYELDSAHQHYNRYLELVTGKSPAQPASDIPQAKPPTEKLGLPQSRGRNAQPSTPPVRPVPRAASAGRASPPEPAQAEGNAPSNPYSSSEKWWTQNPSDRNR